MKDQQSQVLKPSEFVDIDFLLEALRILLGGTF
jgi:hypothetical protein